MSNKHLVPHFSGFVLLYTLRMEMEISDCLQSRGSSSYDIKGKGKTNHDLYSSEDDVSDYEKESNQPRRRVSGCDTRNKVTSVNITERCSSSEVGKSVQRSHYTKEHQGKLEGGKAKNHQPLSSSEESSSEDSVSDFEKESEQVLKIQPERVYKTRSKGPISENLVRKICPAQEKMAGHMDGERKETGCTLRQAISESLQHFYEDLFSEIDRDIRYRKLRPHLYGLVRILTFELKNNMLYKMEGAQPVEWGEAPPEEWEEWK